jgi:hypothetical protein
MDAKIAEWLGWEIRKIKGTTASAWFAPNRHIWDKLPHFSASLDAIMPVVRGLDAVQKAAFLVVLARVMRGIEIVALSPETALSIIAHAEPWEICDALLKVMEGK